MRRIVYSHVTALLNSKVTTLKTFVNTIEQNLGCLKTLNIETASWDAILVPVILSKIDTKLEQEWELHINSSSSKNSIPNVGQLLTFLAKRSNVCDSRISKQNI